MEDVITRLSALKQDIDRGLPDSQKLSDDFKEEQKRRVKYIKDVCHPFSKSLHAGLMRRNAEFRPMERLAHE